MQSFLVPAATAVLLIAALFFGLRISYKRDLASQLVSFLALLLIAYLYSSNVLGTRTNFPNYIPPWVQHSLLFEFAVTIGIVFFPFVFGVYFFIEEE